MIIVQPANEPGAKRRGSGSREWIKAFMDSGIHCAMVSEPGVNSRNMVCAIRAYLLNHSEYPAVVMQRHKNCYLKRIDQ